MPCPDRLSQWSQEVSTAFEHLSKPQLWGLVRMSARGSRCQEQQGLPKSVRLVALVLEQQEQAVFQRLREWYLDGKHKSGKKRRELDVTSCFAPLLCWIVCLWETGNRAVGVGAGCHNARGALDYFVDQRGDPLLRHSGGVESGGRA